MNAFKYSLILAAVFVFAAACSQTATTPNTASNAAANKSNTAPNVNTTAAATPAAPADDVAAAEKLYTTNCMTCHRDSGKGGKVTIDGKSLNPNDLTADKIKKRNDDKLFKDISEGSPDDGMPAFKGKLTDDQIKAVVKHLRKLQGA